MHSFLVIQTASIGDVILATPVLEKLHQSFPDAKIQILVKNGMEQLFHNHPFASVLIWDKSSNKYRNLFRLLKYIRSSKYDLIVNLQRFASTGFITAFGGAKSTVGFDKNPFSYLFSKRVKHQLEKHSSIHEVQRNISLISHISDNQFVRPALYPTVQDIDAIKKYTSQPYICIAPASLWFTKQYPEAKWIDFVSNVSSNLAVFLLGSTVDVDLCNKIISTSGSKSCTNLAGKLTLMQSAALMENANMNFVNDSAPLHLASSVNAPVTAIFCSTITDFGFGPLSNDAVVIETDENLNCRPCGIHGHKKCPQGHFKCATTIPKEKLLSRLSK